jgi:hypothetical protein
MREILELKTPSHMMEWMRLLENHRNLVVEASRDHGKSFLFSYALPLHRVQLIRDPAQAINIALISYSEDQSKKNLARARKQVESNPWLRWLYPNHKSYVWESGMLNFANDCTLEAFGFGSSLRGGHYHLVVVDDPSKDHWTMSITEQENFFYGVILPAVRKGGQLVVCGTPVEKQDLLDRLEANHAFAHFKYPCFTPSGEPLWPDQYTKDDLEFKRRQMPAHIFAREYLLRRVSAADARFREEWIRYYEDQEIAGRPLYRILTIDPALTPGGDALAAVVTGTDAWENTYLLDHMSWRGALDKGVSLLCDMIARNMPLNRVGVESFAFQKMYKVWLDEELKKRGLSVWVEEIGTDSHKSKVARIEALQPKLAQGRLAFKREHKLVIDQFLLWDPISKTNDEDSIDALAWQVGMWRSPIDDAPAHTREARPGSFQEAFEQATHGDRHWLAKLFEDMQPNA